MLRVAINELSGRETDMGPDVFSRHVNCGIVLKQLTCLGQNN